MQQQTTTLIKVRVTYGNRGMSAAENEQPRYPDEVMELPSLSNIGDLFYQLHLRYTLLSLSSFFSLF